MPEFHIHWVSEDLLYMQRKLMTVHGANAHHPASRFKRELRLSCAPPPLWISGAHCASLAPFLSSCQHLMSYHSCAPLQAPRDPTALAA